MRRKVAALYVYNVERDEFKQYFDLTYDQVSFDHRFDGVKDHVYAYDFKTRFRCEISKHEGQIFHDRDRHEYRVYLYKHDIQKAVRLLMEHVLNKVDIEICYHEKTLDELKDKREMVKTRFDIFKKQFAKQ